jgi:hypothetical protein
MFDVRRREFVAFLGGAAVGGTRAAGRADAAHRRGQRSESTPQTEAYNIGALEAVTRSQHVRLLWRGERARRGRRGRLVAPGLAIGGPPWGLHAGVWTLRLSPPTWGLHRKS